jgi:Flp pilus assembly protein TadB
MARLTFRERRVLRDIEKHLMADPEFMARADGGPERTRSTRRLAVKCLTGLLAATVLAVLPWADPVVVPFATAILLLCAAWARRYRRRRGRRATASVAGAAHTAPQNWLIRHTQHLLE